MRCFSQALSKIISIIEYDLHSMKKLDQMVEFSISMDCINQTFFEQIPAYMILLVKKFLIDFRKMQIF